MKSSLKKETFEPKRQTQFQNYSYLITFLLSNYKKTEDITYELMDDVYYSCQLFEESDSSHHRQKGPDNMPKIQESIKEKSPEYNK